MHLQPGEIAVVVYDAKILDSLRSLKAIKEYADSKKNNLMICGYIGPKEAIFAEMDKYKGDPKYRVFVIYPNQPPKTIRPITWGDLQEGGIVVRNNEAAILVFDKAKMLRAEKNPAINFVVSAFAGDPELILAEKAKYDKHPKYLVEYSPAEM